VERTTGKIAENRFGDRKVEIEVKNIEELKEVLKFSVDRVMLDNFSPQNVKRAVDLLNNYAEKEKKPEVEISGGIHEDNIQEYCVDGVDFISIGALTHSVKSLDMSLVLKVCENEK
jgi:nicotinate-nucleotide pyrophosphorylase (carboxylating)